MSPYGEAKSVFAQHDSQWWWIQSKPFLSCCEKSLQQDSVCLVLTLPRELQSGSTSIIPQRRGPSHGRLTTARMHKRWARAKHSQPSSIFGLMREALVELNLQRQWRDIIICHLGSQQNRWHHLEQAARGKRWNYGPQRLSRIHQTLVSCHKPMPSVEKSMKLSRRRGGLQWNRTLALWSCLQILVVVESCMLLYFSSGFCRFGVSETGSSSENQLEMTVWGFCFII